MLSLPRPKDIIFKLYRTHGTTGGPNSIVKVVVVWESSWNTGTEKVLPTLTFQRLFNSLCYYLEEFQDLSQVFNS